MDPVSVKESPEVKDKVDVDVRPADISTVELVREDGTRFAWSSDN
jgi:hypothetical protein